MVRAVNAGLEMLCCTAYNGMPLSEAYNAVVAKGVDPGTWKRSGGVVTPPHSAGIYFLFGFILFGILFASRCSRLASFAACCAVCRAPFRCFVALLLMCVVGLL